MNWLFTKRSTLKGTVESDIASIDQFEVIYSELPEFRRNGHAWLFLRHLKPQHTLVLWTSVRHNRRSHWLRNFEKVKAIAETVRKSKADLILHSPTDPIYLDWAKELKVKCIQTWLAFPFARRFEWRSRAYPIPTGMRWSFTVKGRKFESFLKELDSAGIMVFGLNDDIDSMLSKLAAASILRQIPIMVRDDDNPFWRAVTFGGKDCSIYASAPIAFDEDSMSLLLEAGKRSWRRFWKTWINTWLTWTAKMQEFWHEQYVREKFKEVFGRELFFLDWAAMHHFYLFDTDQVKSHSTQVQF